MRIFILASGIHSVLGIDCLASKSDLALCDLNLCTAQVRSTTKRGTSSNFVVASVYKTMYVVKNLNRVSQHIYVTPSMNLNFRFEPVIGTWQIRALEEI